MRLLTLLIAVLAIPTASLAQDVCPEIDLRSEERQLLLEELAKSPDASTGQTTANKLWKLWTTAPDEKAQFMLDDGMSRRTMFALADAETILDALVSYCPNFPEGWNQRAFVRYLRDDFDGSLEDIERTLELEPDHFGALSGKALALVGLGKEGLAKLAVVRAIEVHPWLTGHGLLRDGEDI